MAWTEKILRVNLTKGTCESEPLNMDWAAKYLGQRGLATKYLVEEIDPKVDPLSPDNKLIFATGIANIYARDPMAMNAIHQTVSELAPGRFVLGLGVSHAPLVKDIRGHEYQKPVPAMRAYLDAMETSRYVGPEPKNEAPIVLAALRKHMLRLGGNRTQGVHPYLVPPEHTRKAREILGQGPWLCPEQMVLAETDAAAARELGRQNLAFYLTLPNYLNNLRELGFSERDFEDGGSDKLIDGIIAWGDIETIRERIQAHYDAGADHVCIQALRTDGQRKPDLNLLEKLAPGQ